MQNEHDTSPTASPHSYTLGVEMGRIRSQLELILSCLMVLLQRSLPPTPTTTSATSGPPPKPGLVQKLLDSISTEAAAHLLERLGMFLLRKVLPAALASALAAASGLGTLLSQWLGPLARLLGF
jgi:hypothetical protein